MQDVDILLPTYNRPESLIMRLSGVAAQTLPDMRLIVADQSAEPVADIPSVQALRRVITARGGVVDWHTRPPLHGIAEQRDFLLRQATADAVLYLDDDVLMEPWVVARLLETLRAERCAFVGAFPAGLSYHDDVRPHQQAIEFWDGPVHPEAIGPLPLLRDLAARSPYIDRVVPFPGFPGLAEQFFDARRATHFFGQMQEERFDLAVQMHGSGVYANPFTLLLGARATAGFVRPGDGAGRLDAALPLPSGVHEVRRVLALPLFLGAPSRGEDLEFPLWAEDHAAAEALLAGVARPLIGLHTGARDSTRRWAVERFATTASELWRRHGGTVVVVGDMEERAAGETVVQAVAAPCLNLAGRTSPAQLGSVIARLAVLVTNDTGPAHVAYALRVPTVTVFGGGSPALNGPLQPGPYQVVAHPVPCRPCEYSTCPIGYTCLEGVTTPRVVEAAEQAMAQRGSYAV